MIKKSYVTTKAGQVHLRQAGEGLPVLLLHWTPSSGRQYEGVMHALAPKGYRLIAPDLMGCGRSDPKPGQWLIEDFAANLVDVLDGLNIDSAHVVGGHVASEITTELALSYPDRVERIVLDGCPVWSEEKREQILNTAITDAPKADEEGALAQWAWKKHLWLMKMWNPSYTLSPDPAGPFLGAFIDYLETGFDTSGAEALRRYDMAAALARIGQPALAVTATSDPLHDCYRDVLNKVDGCVGYCFQGVHPLHDSARAEEYAALLDAFFDGRSIPEEEAGVGAASRGYS